MNKNFWCVLILVPIFCISLVWLMVDRFVVGHPSLPLTPLQVNLCYTSIVSGMLLLITLAVNRLIKIGDSGR